MNRLWSRTLPGLLALSMLAAGAGRAHAAAEVHKFSLVISAMPSQITGGDFNDEIDLTNTLLSARSLETLKKISFGWQFDAELRYFVRPNFAVAAGVGQLRSKSSRQYSFTRTDDVTVTAEVLSAPIHVGGDFYLTPYNQGDFQARAYIGGGLLSLTSTHGSITFVQQTTSFPGTIKSQWVGDSPGWYAEVGAHMFFAVRYSVMLGVIYRSAVVKPTYSTFDNTVIVPNFHAAFANDRTALDMGGAGARMSVAIGF